MSDSRQFVTYEYKEIAADGSKVSFLMDGYESFGWELDKKPVNEKKILRLKRNRKIVNKTELTRLQRNFESCLDEIEKLEKAKTSTAFTCALVIGIIGTAFMAGSVFAVTAEPPRVLLCILLALPGFAGWIAPYFVYRWMAAKRAAHLAPLVEKKYEEIYELFEKGNRLR